MELKILKGTEAIDRQLVEQIIELDKRNMKAVLEGAGLEFPEEKRRKALEDNPTLIVAFDRSAVAGYLEYLRSWRDPRYIYIGSIQISLPYRHTRLLLMLMDSFRSVAAEEDFRGFETSVQRNNEVAVKIYQKLGFKLEENPRNEASWLARAGRELLTDSPFIPLLDRWRARREGRGPRSKEAADTSILLP